MDADGGAAPTANGDAAEAPAPAPERKRRVKKTPLPVSAAGVAGWTDAQRLQYIEAEGQMAAADKLQEDTNEAKNALETYIYALRGKLYEGLAPYVPEVCAALLLGVYGCHVITHHVCCNTHAVVEIHAGLLIVTLSSSCCHC